MPKFATLFPEPSLFPGYPISLGFVVDAGYTGPQKYAVNAALQDLQNNDYSEFVIFE